MVRSGVDAIKIETQQSKPTIFELLCSGCGICVRRCPFECITIVNLPEELEGECAHRFGTNAFKLYRMVIPQPGAVTGLIGKNGIGKSTALKILAGLIKPNLGDVADPPDWPEIVTHYRGSLLQDHFLHLSEGRLKVVHKPQYVDKIPKVVTGRMGELLERVDERGKAAEVSAQLQLTPVREREIRDLSGGELQRLAVASTFCRDADLYLFDEPSSYLDVKQRVETAKLIRSLADEGKAIVVVEHDLTILDYLSDYVCILYGEPGVYGVLSKPHGVRVGINIYLNGYLPEENVRFREIPIRFDVKPPITSWKVDDAVLQWKDMAKSYEAFTLATDTGQIHRGEVIGILGPNGIGKTTFIKLLAGIDQPDGEGDGPISAVDVSYKPQYISVDYQGTVASLLHAVSRGGIEASSYRTEILRPLGLERLLDRQVQQLSGGELQRVAIASCLSRDSRLYLLDEPSAYLDVEERLAMARTIRRVVESRGSTAFVVEHDVSALDFIADRIMVFEGDPGRRGYARSPEGLRSGMNRFLQVMAVTFRRDPTTKRPRVNKPGSRLDRYQKRVGEYYYDAIEGAEDEA
jgi:ATP-binding cassette subfamily E protein 1